MNKYLVDFYYFKSSVFNKSLTNYEITIRIIYILDSSNIKRGIFCTFWMTETLYFPDKILKKRSLCSRYIPRLLRRDKNAHPLITNQFESDICITTELGWFWMGSVTFILCITKYKKRMVHFHFKDEILTKVSVLGVESIWGDCTFIPADCRS